MATPPMRPSIQSLDESLKDLVHWERVAIHLPEMSQSMIDVIKAENQGNIAKQKLALYDRWLKACPHATWSNVVDALEIAEEMRLAGQIQTRVDRFNKKASHEITVTLAEKVDEGVVTELKRLNNQFQHLEEKAEKRCNQLVKSNTINLDELVSSFWRLKSSYGISNLHSIGSTTQLFEVLSCHYTFLDCDLFKEVLDKLPDSADLCSNILLHQTNVSQFKRKASIRQLHDNLQPYVRKANMEEISLKVLFELEDAWGLRDMSLFEVLLKTMFPTLCKNMKWYKIECGSVHITMITIKGDEEMIASLIAHNQTFMGLMGVTSIKINGRSRIAISINKTEDYSFDSALLNASLSANTEALLFLLNVILVSVDHQDKNGNTALDIAVDNNHIEVAQIILNAKANPNHQRDDGNTPLHIACYKGYTQLALMLIKYGANPSIPNTKGDTPFLSSIRGNMMEVVTMIAPKLPQSQIPSVLLLACRLGYSGIISFLLQYIDPPGSSTIHQYCANGDLALAAEHIVQFSEDVNSSLVLGITPLMIASSCGHIEVVECLIEANADVKRIDEDGYSPLAYAITGSGSVPVIECLLQTGANPCITVGGDSLLQMTKQQGNSDLVDLLLQFMALQLYDMFSSLVDKIQEDLTSEIDQHKITLQEIKSKLLSDPEFSHIEGIAEASSCSELFTILQPHYDFLSWKVISCLSDRLKRDGYFKQVKMVEGDLAIQSLPQVASLFPQQSISLSSTGELSVSLDKQWGDKTLFNLRGLNSLLFSSLARLMSHLTVSVTQQEIIVIYQIPRSIKVADRIKSIVSQKKELCFFLGITSIKLNNEVILQIGLNKSFSFDLIIQKTLAVSPMCSTKLLTEIIEFLLKFKDINIDSDDSKLSLPTALYIASDYGNKSVVDLLLSHGAHPNITDNSGFTPLMVASMRGYLEIVKALVNKCPSAVNTTTVTSTSKHRHLRTSPLAVACTKGHTDIVKFLLENGANPNFLIDDVGSSLFMLAIGRQNMEIINMLLEAGADPHVIDNNGFNALMGASSKGDMEGVKLLLSYNADYRHSRLVSGIPLDAFAHACYNGSKETVDVYLSNTDLSDRSLSLGWYLACLSNNVHLIGYLVNSLPQLSIGRRELVTACVEGDLAYIRNNLGNPDDVFVHGVTPLMIACSCDNTSIVEALLNAGVSAVKEDEFGKQAIDYCKEHSSIPDVLQTRFSNERMKRTFDKNKLFEDIIPVAAGKGIPAFNEHLPALSNIPFTF